LISIYYDFRIQSAVCLIVAGLLWARAQRPSQPLRSWGGRLRFALVLTVAAGAMYAALHATEDEYSATRRGTSDIGRAFGKEFAMKAISNSPWLGYGSWSTNSEFQRLQREALTEVAGREASKFSVGDSSSATHSMILQAWVEGGILGTAFFFVLAFLLIRNLNGLALTRPIDALSPVLIYFALYGLWHIVMSAFAAPLRVQLALAAVSIVCLALEQRLALGLPRSRATRTALPPRFARRSADRARVSL
jgi:O-antigen ligase